MNEVIFLDDVNRLNGFRNDTKKQVYEFYRYLQSIQTQEYWRYSISESELMQLLNFYDLEKLLIYLREVAKKVVKTKGYFVIRHFPQKRKIMFISYK
jgi:hypothetical protein